MNFWRKHNKSLKNLAGFAVTAVILYFAWQSLKTIDIDSIKGVKIIYPFATLSVFFMFSNTVFRALLYMSVVGKRLKFWDAMAVVNVGNAGNMVLPFRAGEGLRAGLFPKGFDAADIGRAIIAPFLPDTAIMMSLALFSFAVGVFDIEQINKNAANIISAAAAALAAVFAILCFIPQVREKIKNYLKGYKRVFLFGLLSWTMIYASLTFSTMALGFYPFEAVKIGLAIMVATNLALLIPAAPGGIGFFEFSIMLVLSPKVGSTTALAMAVLIHIFEYIATLPPGIGFYLYHRFKKL